ncbi:unnamed protein product [Mucor hiemalis]
MRKELAEERQLQDLQRMQEDAGTKKRSNKLDWMYASPNANLNGSADNSMEDFYWEKRMSMNCFQAATDAEESKFTLSNSNANTERDIQSKIREDPLLMIKKREQMALKAIVENPLKLKNLKKKDKKDKKKDKKSSGNRLEERSSSRRDDYKSSRGGSIKREERSSRSDRTDDRSRRDDRYSSSSRRRSASPRRR